MVTVFSACNVAMKDFVVTFALSYCPMFEVLKDPTSFPFTLTATDNWRSAVTATVTFPEVHVGCDESL